MPATSGRPWCWVGDRQEGREADTHVLRVAPESGAIVKAIRQQLRHGRYAPSALYGDGDVSRRIAESLGRLTLYRQKRLHYIHERSGKGEGSGTCGCWES